MYTDSSWMAETIFVTSGIEDHFFIMLILDYICYKKYYSVSYKLFIFNEDKDVVYFHLFLISQFIIADFMHLTKMQFVCI